MEQDVKESLTTVCSSCLSADRNLYSIDEMAQVKQVYDLLMSDFAASVVDMLGEQSVLKRFFCWECLTLLKKIGRFKIQMYNAQKHLHVLAMSRAHESVDHTYISQSLSSLDTVTKVDYDKIFFDYTVGVEWTEVEYLEGEESVHNVKAERLDVAQAMRENIHLEAMHPRIVDELVLDSGTGVSHIMIDNVGNLVDNFIVDTTQPGDHYDMSASDPTIKGEVEYSTLEIGNRHIKEMKIVKGRAKEGTAQKCGFTTEYMSEEDMLAARERAKLRVQYASAVYKCELCIMGFYNQQQVEDHFVVMHRTKPGLMACKVCYIYIDERKLSSHLDQHYFRYQCKMCSHVEYSVKLISNHVKAHMSHSVPNSVIKIDDSGTAPKRGRKRKMKSAQDPLATPCKPGDLRKLLSKKTIEGYQCLECDMFFKNSRARKNHVQRFHREGLQCDHCKKRFVNRTTLATHLRLHEGPLPREECPVCHKQVRVIQLKYHIQRHQNKGSYECDECKKVFSHLTTFQAHLKYSRAHASDDIFKFPCPMCNKGYPTKEQMQDHFNYQHLGKTAHKCPICDKPIASRLNVEKHLMRVHGEKKEKPRNHVCLQCGKAFTDKKALTQHEVIHSGERPLVCDICDQTFKQKASLYTHKKRVHKMFPQKKIVEFIDQKP